MVNGVHLVLGDDNALTPVLVIATSMELAIHLSEKDPIFDFTTQSLPVKTLNAIITLR